MQVAEQGTLAIRLNWSVGVLDLLGVCSPCPRTATVDRWVRRRGQPMGVKWNGGLSMRLLQ